MSVTSASQWIGPQSDEVELPSGNTAKLRRSFPVYTLIRTGKFPTHLFEAFNEYTAGELDDPDLAAELLDLIVASMFVEPVVSTGDKRRKNMILVSDIDDSDIDVVLERAFTKVKDADTFRGDGLSDDDSPHGEDVEHDSIEPRGDDSGDDGSADAR